MSTIVYSTLTITETVGDRGKLFGSKGRPIGNGLRGIKWSRDRWRHM